MGLIQKTICPKCGNEYSVLRAECPHCGARKRNPSSRAPSSSDAVRQGTSANMRANANTRWQLVFGLCILTAIIVGVIVLITTTLNGDYDQTVKATASAAVSPSSSPSDTSAAPSPSGSATPATSTPAATPTVESITFTFLGQKLEEFSTNVGETTQLGATVYPTTIQGTLEWSSSDESKITVDQTGLVTAVGSGWADVTVTCYGVSASCKVWVR